MMLTWKDLSISVPLGRDILKNVSGFARSGECLAIMGGSGSGKSTLLNALSNRINKKTGLQMKGEIELNKQALTPEHRYITGFVAQRDLFFEDLTVGETLDFVSQLKPQRTENNTDTVTELLEELKLTKTRNSYVGGKFRVGLSGGEKRRLSVGAELLTQPKLLLLDEPTSGLDSYTGFVIINKLKRLAKKHNIIIIFTLHQPSYEIYELCENLMFLNHGKVTYLGKREALQDYLLSINHPCPKKKLPADFLLDLAIKGGNEIEEVFEEGYTNRLLPDIKNIIKQAPSEHIPLETPSVGIFKQFWILLKRSFTNYIRNRVSIKLRLIQVIVSSIICNLLYYQIPSVSHKNPSSITDRLGIHFYLTSTINQLFYASNLLVCNLTSSLRKTDLYERV